MQYLNLSFFRLAITWMYKTGYLFLGCDTTQSGTVCVSTQKANVWVFITVRNLKSYAPNWSSMMYCNSSGWCTWQEEFKNPAVFYYLLYLENLLGRYYKWTPQFAKQELNIFIPTHAMKTYNRSSGVTPPVLNLTNRWREVVIFTSQPLYFLERSLIPIEWGAGCIQSWAGHCGEQNLLPLLVFKN